MGYVVKEIFKTLQGEGRNAGRASVFCRFVGCNLWTGREADRAGAVCKFCDTDFLGTDGLGGGRFVVFTGGEPLLQLDPTLLTAVRSRGFTAAVETNGTLEPPAELDWVCVSPKAGAPLIARRGDELKLVFPQPGLMPDAVSDLDFTHFWLQPMDGPDRVANTAAAVAHCLAHPQWRLSLQTHKLIGIP
jgi:7-carboxy-7-deazaguanine synthase